MNTQQNQPDSNSEQPEAALSQALHDPENQPSQFDTVPAGQLVGVRASICMVPLQGCPGAEGRSIILPDTPEIRRVLDNQGVTFA